MTLLQSCLIDVLEPEADVFPYYEIFLYRYSLITGYGSGNSNKNNIEVKCSFVPSK